MKKVELETLRHSTSHVLAQAVKELFPKVKLGIGPSTEEGFYYDFDKKDGFTNDDLRKIEKKMQEIIDKDLKIKKIEVTKQKAKEMLQNEPYKLELLGELSGKVTFYQQGDFFDLCKGPHINSTGEIKAFKLMKIAGAYWRGSEKNPMLTRIYGTAFFNQEELKTFLELIKEAERRDHKKIGKEMGIFMISDLVGKGLPIWLPNGEIIKSEIEKLAIEMEDKAGYIRVKTPHIAKQELFIKSGHLPHYEDTMYPKMKMDDGTYYLKAMNCPIHHLIYNHDVRSYKDLPIRIAEYGTMYRNELSGTLSGLLRVRMLTMNDAHIYCRKDQISTEIESLIKLIKQYYKIFGLKDYYVRLSLWDPKNKEKYINEPKNWQYAENELRKLLRKLKINFIEAKNEAAFYGPKIDFQFKTVTGREETLSTIQLDFAAKSRFNFKYFDKDGTANREVFVIHRAPLSVHERFMAFLIEHYAGKFPLWLAPVQVKLLTVNDRNKKFAKQVYKDLKDNNIRVKLDDRSESIGKKVRDAQIDRVPLVVTIGDKEVESNTLAIRTLNGNVKFGVKVNDFVETTVKEIQDKKC